MMFVHISYVLLKFIPPLLSYIPVVMFLFRNVVWVLIWGQPEQGGRPISLPMQEFGVGRHFADACRGVWIFRNRDASWLFVLPAFMFFQFYAWGRMGLASLLPLLRVESTVFNIDGWERAPNSNAGDHWPGLPQQGHTRGRAVVLSLLTIIVVCAVMCKCLSMRSVYEPKCASITTSPVWAIVKQKAYNWLHPRIIFSERHVALPLRAFYCYERDAIMERFDGYSIALDCPIAASNHVWFFILVISFTGFQWLMFFWGWTQTNQLLNCPRYDSFLHWLIMSMYNLLVHALPCPDTRPENASVAYSRLFWWLKHVIPSEANHLGVWILQYTFIIAVAATLVSIRQVTAAAYGATRMELANPTATYSGGGLVSIFTDTHPLAGNTADVGVGTSMAEPWLPPEGYTEGLLCIMDSRPVGSSKRRRYGRYCIYSESRFSIVNIIMFLLGRAGRRWRGAMAVSPANQPIMRPSVLAAHLE
ncbi:hypothetical protein TRVL_10036 [Trypanosoma vivax]|nr:hypothetical protein TRVL_10036 [Trypanosoma vivax]